MGVSAIRCVSGFVCSGTGCSCVKLLAASISLLGALERDLQHSVDAGMCSAGLPNVLTQCIRCCCERITGQFMPVHVHASHVVKVLALQACCLVVIQGSGWCASHVHIPSPCWCWCGCQHTPCDVLTHESRHSCCSGAQLIIAVLPHLV
jgi:hypothetical protein